VITLSAYTQPPPIDTKIALSELPQTQIRETNEIPGHDDEQDSFAEILAGIMHKDGEEEQRTEEETQEVSLDDYSGAQIDAAAFAVDAINFLNKQETAAVVQDEIPESGLSEIGFSEIEISQDSGEILSDMGDMQVYAQAIQAEDAEQPQNLLDAGILEQLADFPQENTAAAVSSMQEALSVQARGKDNKKDGDLTKTENVDTSLMSGRSKETVSLQKETEKDNRVKPGETQNRGRKDKLSFEVRDMRSGANNQDGVTQIKAGAEIAAERENIPVKEITLELKLPSQAQSTAQTAWEAKAGTVAVENMLARELHQNFNGDIVRHASIALHDGGESVIKLALKPDSLGNVKIHLKMSENKITGHIVVESEEALNAFKKEIASLEQAFRESGFTNAQLNLSLTADQQNADWQEQKTPSFLPGIAAARYDESYSGDSLPVVDVFFGQRNGSINMLA